jgi:hypothetical protein
MKAIGAKIPLWAGLILVSGFCQAAETVERFADGA